ncbi:glycosyltransferase family 2 protein [Pseudaestuariivita atlantica]|uniref:Glycosyl transferase family 2 n=1 Tax=Pseudaestuariivita atlantica TaxID=1317121 RepID=A0A0L1JKW1_9RHOB|nr:glycosyltransferase family 2 protein [Pseudaestuariivita atlantica]KNG92394.1 glycosyl transferase family 2 [Pseudaestuariivita atlantica]
MKMSLHIGCDAWSSARMQAVLDLKRGALGGNGILYPRAPGRRNHTRLAMAVSDRVDTLRFNRGFAPADKQEALYHEVRDALTRELADTKPDHVILSAQQLGTGLTNRAELERLHSLLSPHADTVEIVIAVTDPATALARHFANMVQDGRAAPLSRDLDLLEADDWWEAARSTHDRADPPRGIFPEVQGAPHWLDTGALAAFWGEVFGTVRIASVDEARLAGTDAVEEIARIFDLPLKAGKVEAVDGPDAPSAAWLERGVAYNDLLLKLIAHKGYILPRQMWRRLVADLHVPGDGIAPGSLSRVSDRFGPALERLAQDHPALDPAHVSPPEALLEWTPPDPMYGFRASQYLRADVGRIRRAQEQARAERGEDIAALSAPPKRRKVTIDGLTAQARALLPPAAQANFARLQGSTFRPHNKMGLVNEEDLAAAFTPAPERDLPKGSTGNVIVGCMKNEAPYIVEWVAYHRAIGVDNFLIYTNGCEDSTSTILDRMQEMGLVEHRQNEDWKGKSPQQFALNKAMKEPVVRKADWLIHIDVDEYMNVRCGNGTLDDFFDRVPGATNVAMTWRLFGHNGITRFEDDLVIDQFDSCAPKYCPKPHTVWGFKTMFRNIGAYQKMSCHRPNQLKDAKADKVRWVNGSGLDMTAEAIKNGWRSSKKSIGYDLLQLNHYALRSAESFLIKRQRGRALHVNRSIGLNYWIRMDWSDYRDITIKRNIPRVRAEMDRLLADPELRRLHDEGVAWHRAKADELHAVPEFAELYEQALACKLTTTERVAYALALDLES